MRPTYLSSAFLATVLGALVLQPAMAAESKDSACANRNALSVSRVIEIDPAKSSHFGTQQYDRTDPLADGEVVLTFDDGPLRRNTAKVLEALEQHCTKATFFVVGRMSIADPDMLRKVAAGGHTIGHHTWSHQNQKTRSMQRAIAEFELGVSAVEAVIGRPSAPFFRFPYLSDPMRMQQYITQRKFGIFSIDIDSYDWKSKSASRVRSQIMSELKRRRKGIILFHDIQSATATALGDLLDDMQSSGFKIVHIVPKATAETLPEYDEEARVLLEKRNYGRSARPLKTAFKFDEPAAAESSRSPDSNSQASVKPSSTSAPVAKSVQGPSPAQVVKPTGTTHQEPDWRAKVLGLRP